MALIYLGARLGHAVQENHAQMVLLPKWLGLTKWYAD